MRTRPAKAPASMVALAALLVACTGGGGGTMTPSIGSPEGPGGPAPGETAGASPAEPNGSPSVGGTASAPPGVPADVWSYIAADAAAIGGVDPSAVRVIEASAVEWSDGSLGCPEPGMNYTQAIVPGWQVVVEVNGETIDYRATGPGAFRICPNDAQAEPTV